MLVLNRAELGVEGVCGGCCVCATCHVYIDDSQGRLPPVAADEAMLLDGLMERNDHSRLACQLTCDDMPEDLLIRIAPAE
jgi:2Fe-2S ferredoxin